MSSGLMYIRKLDHMSSELHKLNAALEILYNACIDKCNLLSQFHSVEFSEIEINQILIEFDENSTKKLLNKLIDMGVCYVESPYYVFDLINFMEAIEGF